ncbi:TonB-dependent receptor [Pedobacter sp. ok626]|nr:TonB-dependent receptor [Pedobacter sp. ok626]
MYNSTKINVIKSLCAMTRFAFLVTTVSITLTGVLMGADVKSQNLNETKVTLTAKRTILAEVLNKIEQQSEFSFSFSKKVGAIALESFQAENKSLANVLKDLTAGRHLKFTQLGDLIALSELPLPPKPGRISGKISGQDGESLPGASVKVVETGNTAQAGADGSYIIDLQPGTYTLVFSYISFQTQRVTGVLVTGSRNTPLNVSLKMDSKGLKEVVVSSDYKKASVAGLLAKQKNAAEISNGISAEQISRSPDKNIGESLKRISGVSSVDNKFVLVRGIGERYNSATLDGTVLPSTEAQTRNFSFDMIPSNLVDNVVVSKTITPDMNASFAGGLIQVNTKDIPSENFMSFTAGMSYNDQSTGKDFLSHKRGRYDYWGFDDGGRNSPSGLMVTDKEVEPNRSMPEEQYQQKLVDQSRRFTNDNFTVYKYKTAPSQNYQFTIGRLLKLDTLNKNRFGFTGSLSYRNTQNINEIERQNRSDWNLDTENPGKAYGFNTTIGVLLNAGLQLGKNRITLRNVFTHMYDNTLVRNIGYDNVIGGDFIPLNTPQRIQEADDPTFTDLLQNKLSGQHQLGRAKFEWELAKTLIARKEKDLTIANSGPQLVNGAYQYFYIPGNFNQPQISDNLSRHTYKNDEHHYSWTASVSVPFKVAGFSSTAKTGYFGNNKKAGFNWQIAALGRSLTTAPAVTYLSVSDMQKPENLGVHGLNYATNSYWLDSFEGKSKTHALYAMLDNRFFDQLRLIWGVRADYYKYTDIKNPKSIRGASEYMPKPDKSWQWLPSANLTYSPISQINIRAAYSSTIVRPEMMENSQFLKYSPYLGGQFGNLGLYSTRIGSYDLKTEWFPGLGEIISAGVFYKKFDKPVELTVNIESGNLQYYITNADQAKVYGLELELRKNFGFIVDNELLKNLTAYGNLTLQKSEVVGTFRVTNPDKTPGAPSTIELTNKKKRPMYGQSPYLINAGLQYTGKHFGFNFLYNKSGLKTYIVSANPGLIEYERPREQIDLQFSYKLLKNRCEIKFNAGNLLNTASSFYINQASYERNPDYDVASRDLSSAFRLKPGFTDKYEDGDLLKFVQRFGRTYSTVITYNF